MKQRILSKNASKSFFCVMGTEQYYSIPPIKLPILKLRVLYYRLKTNENDRVLAKK